MARWASSIRCLPNEVDWPWFVVSQIIFGLSAAVVVVRSEMVHIPPARTRTFSHD